MSADGTTSKLDSKTRIVLVALLLGSFMTALDATIVSVALPDMAAFFGAKGSTADISWVLLSYTLMLCCFILLWAKLGTNIGYGKVFKAGMLIFTVTSLFIGVSGFTDMGLGAVILLRAVQGLGAGMAMAMSLAMVGDYMPKEVRGSCIGLITLAASAGTAFGPALGGILTSVHWSLIFLINVPIGVAAIILAAKSMDKPATSAGGKIDKVGAVLMFAMMLAAIFYLEEGGDLFGWIDPTGVAIIAVAMLAAGILAWWEQRSGDPLISVRLLGLRNVVGANIVALITMAAMAGSYLLLPFYLSMVDGYSTVQYGLILITNSVGMMASGLLVGKAVDRGGSNRRFISIGCLVAAVGFFMFTMFGVGTGLWFVLLSLFVMGAGTGMVLVATTNLCYGYGRSGEDGQLSGIITTFRNAGSSAGVAILNCVFMSALVVSVGMPDGLIPGFRHAFFVAMVMCFVAFIISMALKDSPAAES